MKNTFKNKYIGIIFAIIVGLFCISCSGCNGCNKNNENQSDSSIQTEAKLSLDKTQAIIVLGDELYLKADYGGAEDSLLTWTSNNESVASVENGKIISNSVGGAVITANYADKSAQCAVTITTNDMLPTLLLENIPNDDVVTVSLSDKLNFSPCVEFNGKTFRDGVFDVKISDSAVGSYEEGVFTPIAIGEVALEISGKWRGIEGPCLNKTISVKVINNLSVVVNGGLTSSVLLYTAQTHGGKSYDVSYPFVVSAQENGKDIEYSVAVSSGYDIVAYNEQNKTVNALKYGSAVITVSFKDGSGEMGVLNVPVTVNRPVAEYSEIIEYFSAMDGDLPIGDIFGKTVNISDAYCDGNALTIQNGKILGVKTEKSRFSQKIITVYNETVGYVVKVNAYTKVIKVEDDLSVFNSDFDGYVVLANDIECSGVNTLCNGGVFKGIFDGNGHLIKNIKVSVNTGANPISGGIFGVIGDNAIIKNFGVENADVSAWNSSIIAGSSRSQYTSGALIENIYISIAKSGSRPAPLIWSRGPWDRINNVLINA